MQEEFSCPSAHNFLFSILLNPVSMKIDIIEPTLLLDERKCRQNIQRMAEKARRLDVLFRPHFKTHQSQLVGRWFRDYGVDRITVSSLRMAEYFAADGWDDITVAFPVNILERDRINRLAPRIRLNLVAESVESLLALDHFLSAPVDIFIKADTGYHRTGLTARQTPIIDAMVELMEKSPRLRFAGFLAHPGNTYDARGRAAVAAVHAGSLQAMKAFRQQYGDRFPDLIYSLGDTPSCSLMNDFSGIDELRPGNFVFYDLMQVAIGACSPAEVAVALACPVVALHPERSEIVLYGGAVHFSKDYGLLPEGTPFFGYVVEWTDDGWSLPSQPSYVKKISQEHGIIAAREGLLSRIRVGDVLGVLPIHSCLTADVMKAYRSLSGEPIAMMR